MKYVIAPSILSADFANLGRDIVVCEKAGAEYIHIDVMDGSYVPNISLGFPVIKSVRKVSNAVFDVHLMVDEPIRFIQEFRDAGADIITVHQEACKHLDRTVQAVKESGAKVGVSLNPATPIDTLRDIIGTLDMVLLMSVNPGFGGQKFIGYVVDKIRRLRAMADELNPDLDIEVDGGVTLGNAAMLKEAGVNIFVAGSSVYKGDPAENVRKFLEILNK